VGVQLPKYDRDGQRGGCRCEGIGGAAAGARVAAGVRVAVRLLRRSGRRTGAGGMCVLRGDVMSVLHAPGHCPFCGDTLVVVRNVTRGIYEVLCKVCNRTAIILVDDHIAF
jgi:ribosomal protein L37AE/L43A